MSSLPFVPPTQSDALPPSDKESYAVKFQGNAHFRAGDYGEAIQEYQVAINIHGPNAAYLSNMAAAWLKLEL
jgi:Flp pilus assembly protein TadD